MSNDRQSRGGGFARTAINCTASGSWHRLFIESLPNRCSIQSVRNPRSLSAYVLYYVSKRKERPYQISPGVRWMHGRVDNEYIREIECRTWRNYASYLSSIGVELGGIGSWRILSMDSERLRAPFTRLARIYRASDLSDRIFRKSNESLSVLSKIALMISMYLQFKYIEI